MDTYIAIDILLWKSRLVSFWFCLTQLCFLITSPEGWHSLEFPKPSIFFFSHKPRAVESNHFSPNHCVLTFCVLLIRSKAQCSCHGHWAPESYPHVLKVPWLRFCFILFPFLPTLLKIPILGNPSPASDSVPLYSGKCLALRTKYLVSVADTVMEVLQPSSNLLKDSPKYSSPCILYPL